MYKCTSRLNAKSQIYKEVTDASAISVKQISFAYTTDKCD